MAGKEEFCRDSLILADFVELFYSIPSGQIQHTTDLLVSSIL
jgi:hypothetical protein